MKFSAQEEYGLRCLVAIGRRDNIAIPEISRKEGLTEAHVAKLLMILRKGGFVASTRGQTGGYTLSRPAEEISVNEVLAHLGGRLYDAEFCGKHSGRGDVCAHSFNCTIRSLWSRVQDAVDSVLDQVTLADIIRDEPEEKVTMVRVRQILAKEAKPILRIGVKGGGCSGYEYVMRGEEVPRETDLSADFDDLQVICDPKSAAILEGTTVDYTGNLMGGFVFDNPNAARSCGCGTSFSLKAKG
jgi:iron-sulfur cluster assembly accessory protein